MHIYFSVIKGRLEKNEIYSILIISFVKLNLWIIKFISIRALYFKLKSKYALNLSVLLYVTFRQYCWRNGRCRDAWHTMGMQLTCTMCFVIIIGKTQMTRECFFCMISGVTQLELTICMSRKECVSPVVIVKHTWHMWFFFADMKSGITLMRMTISRDFFYKSNPLRNMFKNEPLLKISL